MQELRYKCSIYKDRPQVCRDFPGNMVDVSRYSSCSYWFNGDKRKGECSRCGECCIVTKLYDGICPYLEKE